MGVPWITLEEGCSEVQPALVGRLFMVMMFSSPNSDENSPDFLIYNRGSDDDFDRLASVVQDSGWSASSVHKYFLKVRHLVI